MRIFILFFTLIISTLSQITALAQQEIKVGSKVFTESVILGEVLKAAIEDQGYSVKFFKQLGGSRILWNALNEGRIDIYPDYTGTIINEILADRKIDGPEELKAYLETINIGISAPLGFNNTYAIGMKERIADSLNIQTISDLKEHTELEYGFSNEFLNREDGWKGIKQVYQLNTNKVTGLDHDLAYRGLDVNDIQVIDLYSTDAEIQYYDLRVLEDDRSFFPEYQAILLYDLDLPETYKGVNQIISRLEGAISNKRMIGMNTSVKINGMADSEVAANFLQEELGIDIQISKDRNTWVDRLIRNTLEHLYLVGISLSLAIFLAIPLGIIAVKVRWLEQFIISVTGILQTIPSLALLVFMIPLFGIGSLPAIAALFLYSLLPILRNTHSGLKEIPLELIHSAVALGLPGRLILRKIELPLAAPSILAGIKTSAVINVGTATLGALIGAGGYGQPILTGIRLDDTSLILEGAIPAAILALLVQGMFDIIEKRLSK